MFLYRVSPRGYCLQGIQRFNKPNERSKWKEIFSFIQQQYWWFWFNCIDGNLPKIEPLKLKFILEARAIHFCKLVC